MAQDPPGTTGSDRLREFMTRDRTRSVQDLNRPEHEIATETQEAAKRAYGGELTPDSSPPTLKEVWGDPDHIEIPQGYGYAARQKYLHDHPRWDNDLENELRLEWERAGERSEPWEQVRDEVRRGYEREG
jgi:hypothetical protein